MMLVRRFDMFTFSVGSRWVGEEMYGPSWFAIVEGIVIPAVSERDAYHIGSSTVAYRMSLVRPVEHVDPDEPHCIAPHRVVFPGGVL